MRISPIALAAALSLPARALAADPPLHVDPSLETCEVQFAPELSQSAFRRFAAEFGSVSAFKQGGPPNTLGQWGVSLGLEYIMLWIDDHSDAWNDTFYHPDPEHDLGSRQAYPKFRLRVGVTEDTDVGMFFTKNPASNYGWLGFDLKHALLRQSDEMPVTLSVRGAYTKTLFVSDMDMHDVGADVVVGRTFWSTLTPYAGIGGDVVVARETSKRVDLDTEVVPVPHVLAGMEVRFWHVALGAEAQYGTIPSLQLMASAVF